MHENDSGSVAREDALLAAIVRGAHEAILSIDPAGTILSWNGGATRLLGHAEAEMIGAAIDEIVPEAGRHMLDGAIGRVVAGEAAAHVDTHVMGTATHSIAVSISLSPMRDASGAIIAAAAILREPRPRLDARPSGFRPDRLSSHVIDRGDEDDEPGILPRGNILVVEDEALIGLGLAAMLENAGFEVIGPVGDVTSAMDMLDRYDCALAILDINLRSGETSAPLAQRLKRDGIPFFVTSGHLGVGQPTVFSDVPSFPKPVRAHMLVAAVQNTLG